MRPLLHLYHSVQLQFAMKFCAEKVEQALACNGGFSIRAQLGEPGLKSRWQACSTALVILAAVLRAQPAPEIHVLPVQGNVSMLVGGGGNITVQTGKDGILLVDTGLADA